VSSEIDELVAVLRRALEPIATVRVAYLFGSRARAEPARADSDLDLGVVFASGLDERARDGERRSLVTALSTALGALGERADIVDLEAADSAVAFRAICDGHLVCERSSAERVRIVTRVARRFEDDAPKRALFRRAARDAVMRMRTA
jgi:predicted nucleotidyltransferase